MILVDWQISNLINDKRIIIDPFSETNIQPNSYDITLSHTFVTYDFDISSVVVDPYDYNTYKHLGKTQTISEITIAPNCFILGATLEHIALPSNIAAEVNGKSSLARLGLSIHQTGGWIDAGFTGTITLEIKNVSPYSIKLHAGMPIGQLVFHKTDRAQTPYCTKPTAKYNNQTLPQPSKYFLNNPPDPLAG